jgi:hypothetical protein
MAVFWKFNEDSCVFDPCDRQTAETEADQGVPVIIREFDDLYVVFDRKKRRWPSGDPLILLGIQFDREDYE